jgi:hypothetical protein
VPSLAQHLAPQYLLLLVSRHISDQLFIGGAASYGLFQHFGKPFRIVPLPLIVSECLLVQIAE